MGNQLKSSETWKLSCPLLLEIPRLRNFVFQNFRAIVLDLDKSLSDKAERADRLVEASSSRDVFAVQASSSDDHFRAMEAAILPLTTQMFNLVAAQRYAHSSHARGRSRYHNHYGA